MKDVIISNAVVHPDIVFYSAPGQKLTYSRVLSVDKREMRLGAGAYTCLTIMRLGLNCSIIDKVGSDIFGQFTIDELKNLGCDTTYIKRYRGDHTTIFVLVQEGEGGTMAAYFPKEYLSTSYSEALSMIENIPKSKVIYFFCWYWSYWWPQLVGEPIHEIFKIAKNKGSTIILDINYKPKELPSLDEVEEFKKALPYIDIVLPNIYDAEVIFGKKDVKKTANEFLNLGNKAVCIKMGDKGCYVASNDFSCFIPPIDTELLDTTGAGDMFGGAFTYGWLKDWNLRKIAFFANAVASYGISHEKSNKYPTYSEVVDYLKEKKIKGNNL